MKILKLFGAGLCLISIMLVQRVQSFTTYMQQDPMPQYTSNPFAWLMLDSAKIRSQEYNACETGLYDTFLFALTPYYQKSTRGRDYDRDKVKLGDISGPWHMLGMIYGEVPTATGKPTAFGQKIKNAQNEIFALDDSAFCQNPMGTISERCVKDDPEHKFGYFSVPLKYRKVGVRGEFSLNLYDFGLTIQAGVADVKQTFTNFIDLDPGSLFDLTKDAEIAARTKFTVPQIKAVRCFVLTDSLAREIIREQGMDLCDYQKTTIEDINFRAWWRHSFMVNEQYDPTNWAHFIFTPYLAVQGTYAIAPEVDRVFTGTTVPSKLVPLFSIATGNDKHHSIGFTLGFLIDFLETVEFGIEGGTVRFFDRTVECLRVPTHESQQGIYPFATNVKRKPGDNFHFTASLNAYDFIDRLSAFVQYQFIEHSQDKITLIEDTDKNIFRVRDLECRSKWNSQMLVTALTYDISPNCSLGGAIQWPLSQRNAYRSTTVLGTIQATF